MKTENFPRQKETAVQKHQSLADLAQVAAHWASGEDPSFVDLLTLKESHKNHSSYKHL